MKNLLNLNLLVLVSFLSCTSLRAMQDESQNPETTEPDTFILIRGQIDAFDLQTPQGIIKTARVISIMNRYLSYIRVGQILRSIIADKGADIDVRDEDGVTALIAATVNSDDQMIKILIAAGADPNNEASLNLMCRLIKQMNNEEKINVLNMCRSLRNIK
ncbi:MAG: hypothetical protein WC436_05125 [Candidatus Babeliales bacterium]